MNHVALKGNLTRDPEVRIVEANNKKTSVVNFTLAVSRFFRKSDGSRGQETTYVPCEAWDTGAETIGKYCTKGSPLLIEDGSLKTDSWETEDGQKRSRMKVRVAKFDMLYRSSSKDDSEDQQTE